MEQQLCSTVSAPTGLIVQVCFPGARTAVLDNLNRQREEGRLCDLAIQVQGHVYRAHRCVLAASSPYFHDQVLLKNVTMVSLPSVMDPLAFQSVLASAYTGQLSIVHEDIVNYVTVASFLQMWHIVDKCTELLKRQRPLAESQPGGDAIPSASTSTTAATTSSSSLPPAPAQPGTSSRQQSPSSSDCLYVEREGRRRDRKPDALPPLATWRRPQQFPRWGRARGPSSGPHSAADSQLGASLPGYGDCSVDYAGCEEVWLTSATAAAKDVPTNADAHYGAQLGGGGGAGLEGLRQRVRLHPRASGPERGDRSRDVVEVAELPPAPPVQQERRKVERGGMEADEGVGEDVAGRRDRCVQPGQTGDSHGQTSDGESSGQAEARGRPEDDKDREHGDASLMGRTCGPDHGIPSPSPRMQWQAPWSQAEATPLEEDQSEVDFERLAEGHFEGKTYDEIQDGTGQVSQRPLVPVSPDHHGDFGLAWPSADVASAPATPSRPLTPALSQFPLGPASPPIPSSSSSLSIAGAPYTGKVHFCHCGKAYTLKSMRDRHVKMQHLNLRPFGCPVCGKTFKMKHHLTKHLKTHGGLRPYECGLCGKKVIWRESFLRHQARCERMAAANNNNNNNNNNVSGATSSSGGVNGGPAMGADDAGGSAYGGYGFDHGEAFLALAGQVKVEEADFGGEAVGDAAAGGGGGGRLIGGVAGIMDELRSQSRLLHGHVFKEEASEGFS
ncbi:zinc finger and BTB domain-containing protein 22 [Gadus chalcogrammus]|uniref:zinc finger and BTB domain-containing protein 22 n=1 Tax=Gadus chalcogrammus TaxID=1042646 RepID=UPI0024C49367|nr:zinc finger and BTB domain-containing protein 22 [Gadus chalcogrammus]